MQVQDTAVPRCLGCGQHTSVAHGCAPIDELWARCDACRGVGAAMGDLGSGRECPFCDGVGFVPLNTTTTLGDLAGHPHHDDDQEQEHGDLPALRVPGGYADRDLPDAITLEITDVGISRVELLAALYQIDPEELGDWTPAEVRQFVVGTLMLGGRAALLDQVWRVENPPDDTAAAVFLELCRSQIDTAFGLHSDDEYTYLDPELSPCAAWARFRAEHPQCRACEGDSPDCCEDQDCACPVCLDLARTDQTFYVAPQPAPAVPRPRPSINDCMCATCQTLPPRHPVSTTPYEPPHGWAMVRPKADPPPATAPGPAPEHHNDSRELATTR